MGFPWQSWILTSEIIALFENGKPEYIKENYKHDVYTFDYSERPDKEINHPTVKPLSIVGDVISKTKGQSVLDLFLGIIIAMFVALKGLSDISNQYFVSLLLMGLLTGSINGTVGVNFRYQLPVITFACWVLIQNSNLYLKKYRKNSI